MRSFMVTLWKGWKGFAHTLIQGQNWFLMSLVYFFAVGPVSLFIKTDTTRRLDRAEADLGADSFGLPYEGERPDVRRAQRPW